MKLAGTNTMEEMLLLEAKRTNLIFEDIKQRMKTCLFVRSPLISSTTNNKK
jgi:hypothetical protein